MRHGHGLRKLNRTTSHRLAMFRNMANALLTHEEITTTLPKDMMDRLHVGPGDRVFAVETDHGVLLTPYDPEFEAAMTAFNEVRRQYRNTLKQLAQ